MNNITKYLSYALVAMGVILIVSLRVYGIHLTEGELLIEFFPCWIVAILLIGCGLIMSNRDK